MNVTLWDTSSDVRKELSIQDDRTESDNRIEVTLLIGIAENNLPHIARWESTKPPYAEPHVRWCGRSVNVKIEGECLLWLAFTSYPIYIHFKAAPILHPYFQATLSLLHSSYHFFVAPTTCTHSFAASLLLFCKRKNTIGEGCQVLKLTSWKSLRVFNCQHT